MSLRNWFRVFVVSSLVAAFAILLSPPLLLAADLPSKVLSQKATEASRLLSAASQQGSVSIIVEFASPVAPDAMQPDQAALSAIRASIRAIQDAIIATHFGSATNPQPGQGFTRGIQRLELRPMFAVNVNAAELEALAADPRVVRIHENAVKQPTLEQSIPLIGMPAAYTSGATGNGYAVAVLDTGVKSDHPFLAGKVILEACFSNAGGSGTGTSACPNGQTTQTGAGSASPTSAACLSGSTNLCYHGTHVAGIATGLNATNIVGAPANGVAKSADIVAIQVFTNISGQMRAYTSDIIAALDYVYSNLNSLSGGIKVAAVNMSLGGGQYFSACDSDPTKPSIDNLLAAGVATAIASGNDGWTNSVGSPGCVSTAVTVGSSTKGDAVSWFSNQAAMVDLMAPGGGGYGLCDGSGNSDIHSSYVTNTSSTFACLAGTSMATPHVAGAFAALRTVAPSATPAQILGMLQATGVQIADTRPGGTITRPRIRVDLAAQALINNSPVLVISPPQSNAASSGPQGGPFSPSSFVYQLSASSGSLNYSITGVPSWLTVSSASGTVTTTPTTVTFTVNATANTLAQGTYGPTTVTITNTTNNLGTASGTATLTVTPPAPVNDNFANASPIVPGQTVTGSNTTATKEVGEPVHNHDFIDYGGKSVWWRFTAQTSAALTVNTCGSSFDTVLAVYTGSAVNALTYVASNDEAPSGPCSGGHQSYLTFNAVAGTTYSIVVDGYNPSNGTAANGSIQLSLSAPNLSLLVSPVTNIASSGTQGGPFSPSSFQYQVSASSGSVSYSISGLPAWLNASSTSGTATTSASTITFTVNPAANGLSPGTYNAIIAFANTTNGIGNQTRRAALTVNAGGGGATLANTFVSARNGSDTGVCPRTAPCATLNYALSVANAGGTVNLLDDGVFGPVVLTQAVNIQGPAGAPPQIVANPNAQAGCVGALPSGCGLANHGYAVEVAAGASDIVEVNGLLLAAGAGGSGAVKIGSGNVVNMTGDIFRGNDTATGPIVLIAPANAQTQVYMSRGDVAFNRNGGAVLVAPTGASNPRLHFNHMEVHHANFGIKTDASALSSGNSVNTFVSETEFFSFTGSAVTALSVSGSGGVNSVYNDVNVLATNGPAVNANGPSSTVILTNSTIGGNQTGTRVITGATIFTSVNNTIKGNGTDVSGALTAAPRK